ncbi:hypothetical protein M8J75_010935 [Diaphorina citri]|nr:hypothetical protein M8J75_010935 [Diaphorina citri]
MRGDVEDIMEELLANIIRELNDEDENGGEMGRDGGAIESDGRGKNGKSGTEGEDGEEIDKGLEEICIREEKGDMGQRRGWERNKWKNKGWKGKIEKTC